MHASGGQKVQRNILLGIWFYKLKLLFGLIVYIIIVKFGIRVTQGRHSWGAQGAQAPPKLWGRKLRILQKGGLKPPYIHHILEKWRFSSPSELLCQKKIFWDPPIFRTKWRPCAWGPQSLNSNFFGGGGPSSNASYVDFSLLWKLKLCISFRFLAYCVKYIFLTFQFWCHSQSCSFGLKF